MWFMIKHKKISTGLVVLEIKFLAAQFPSHLDIENYITSGHIDFLLTLPKDGNNQTFPEGHTPSYVMRRFCRPPAIKQKRMKEAYMSLPDKQAEASFSRRNVSTWFDLQWSLPCISTLVAFSWSLRG